MRLIDPNEIYFVACRIDPTYSGKSAYYEHVAFQQDVDQIKRIEAEPVKHAHWVACEDEYGEEYKCSACSGIQFFDMTPQDEGWEYCPYCGAKMDEEEGK